MSIRPPSELFDRVAHGIAALYEQRGRRIDATGTIPTVVCAQGATLVRIRSESPVARPGESLWDWYRQFSCSMLPRVIEAGLLTRNVQDSYDALWTQYVEIRGAFLSVPAQLSVIAEKR